MGHGDRLHSSTGPQAPYKLYSDTSYCAESRAKNGLYRGVLTDRRDRTVTSAPFTVAFESRRDERDVAGFSTDAQGRYCIVWAEERITPLAHVDGSQPRIEAPWRPLNGARPPHGCQAGDGGIPWNRADDLGSSVQFLALPAIAILSAILLLVGLAGTPTGRRARKLRAPVHGRDYGAGRPDLGRLTARGWS